MAVTDVKAHFESSQGQLAAQGNGSRFIARYLVEVDDENDGPNLVLNDPRIPQLGSSYQLGNDFSGLPLKNKRAQRRAGTRLVWDVFCTYTSESNEDELKDENGNPVEDPADAQDKVDVSFMMQRRPIFEGIYRGFEDPDGNDIGDATGGALINAERGNKFMIIRADGSPPVPFPEMDVALMVIRQTFYWPSWVNEWNDYANAINDDTWQIDIMTGPIPVQTTFGPFDPYTTWISNLSGEHFEWGENAEIWYRRITEWVIDPNGWRHREANMGRHARAIAGDPKGNKDGDTWSGTEIEQGMAEKRPIRAPDGEIILDDVWLDKEGKPIIDFDRSKSNYVVYSVKPEKPMANYISGAP